MPHTSNILLCRCTRSHKVADAAYNRIADGLTTAGIPFLSASDLCGAAAAANGPMLHWARLPGLRVVACYPRAVRWLFHRAGAALTNDVQLHNAAAGDPEAILAALATELPSACDKMPQDQPQDQPQDAPQDDWIPWFPVIDYGRCINCRQCLNFCLFGVYGLSRDGRIEVINPRGCKTNCPACARVCPERAIIFPKYDKSPINGNEVDSQSVDDANDRSELEALLGGDVQAIIRQRAARNLFLRKTDADDLSQKQARLSRLQQELDIPQDVLDSLSQAQQSPRPSRSDCPNSPLCDGDCGPHKEHP